MKNNELSKNSLEQVKGGQAVLPLLSDSGKEVDEQMLNGFFTRAKCPACQARFPVALSMNGQQVTCEECGNVFSVDINVK